MQPIKLKRLALRGANYFPGILWFLLGLLDDWER